MDLDLKIAAAKAKRDAAIAAISDDDRAEQAKRAELAQVEAETAEQEQARRELDLERRLDAAKEELGDDAKIKGVSIKEYPDTFIVMRNGKAHAKWNEGIRAAAMGKKVDRAAIDREYAKNTVYDWNGTIDFDKNSVSTAALMKFLTENPGVVTPLLDAAAELSGVFATERKS